MTRAEAAKTQGHCNRRRVRRGACPLGIYPCDRSFESIPRIKCARPATCSWLMHAAKNGRRRGASPFDRQSALGTPLHPPVIEFSARRAPAVLPPPMSLGFQPMVCSALGFPAVPCAPGGHPSIISPRLFLMRVASWVIGEWVMMGGKYSAEWWEKIADLNRDLPVQDPVSVVDHLIQATAHGARTPAKNAKLSGQNPAASKRERSLAD